jgi:sodium-dependent dicarboxylate transporter 2/3/5
MERKIFLALAAVLVGFLVYMLPLGLNPQAHKLLALLATTVLMWLFEVMPLGITALTAVAFAVVLGIADRKTAFANFAHPIIFLFIGSFLLAEAFSKYKIDRYIALFVLSKYWVRKSSLIFIATVLFIPWFLSMWLSNTATTAMLLPIVAGLLATLYPDGSWRNKSVKFLLLAIAYAASVGGITTPVGTPPNLIALGFLEKEGIQISFGEWILKVLPISALTFFALVLYTYRLIGRLPVDRIDLTTLKREKLNFTQKVILFIFLSVVVLWLLPTFLGLLKNIVPPLEGVYIWVKHHLPTEVVALLGASLLFLIPVKEKKETVLTVGDIRKIDWDTILLFGGGLSLGSLMFKTGLVSYIGQNLAGILPSSEFMVLLILTTVVIFLTEISSNTATANVFIPVVIGLSHQLGLDLEKTVMATTLACSYAFMLPMATPPNAIVFGFADIKISEMARVGLVMNLIGIFIISTLVYFLF